MKEIGNTLPNYLTRIHKMNKKNINIHYIMPAININSVTIDRFYKYSTYQESIIPTGKLVFGLTAGLPVNLEGLIGDSGKVIGLAHFGYSAPASVLDEKFGFTSEHVCAEILNYIEESK